MAKKIYYMTPFMPVIVAYTERPDKPYEGEGEPQYKIKFDPSEDDLVSITGDLKKLAAGAEFGVAKPKFGISVSEADGKKTVLCKSKYKPAIYDCANNKLDAPRIGAGTVARAYCELNIWKKGVSLRLLQVQVKKLVEWEGGAGKSAFGETEGFVADTEGFGSDNSNTDTAEQNASALDI